MEKIGLQAVLAQYVFSVPIVLKKEISGINTSEALLQLIV